MAPSSPSLPTFLISFSACPFMILLFTQIPKFQVPIVSCNNYCNSFSLALANITLPFSYQTRVLLLWLCRFSLPLASPFSNLSNRSSLSFPSRHFISHPHVPHHFSLHLGRVILVSTCPAAPTPCTSCKLTPGRISSAISRHQPPLAFLLRLPSDLMPFET